jgi:RNA polymerase sigma factor (TIGR02999 family)
METSHQVTQLLVAWRQGEQQAFDRLLPIVYEELRRVAHRQLSGEPTGHTLSTTALVHETYLKLVDQTRVEWADRAHFFAIAARAMRRVLLDHARRHVAAKRGGGGVQVTLDESSFDAHMDDALAVETDARAETLIGLDAALLRLADLDDRLVRVVECRFYLGLSEAETAEALGVTVRTIRRDWAKAKALLARDLAG